MSDDSKRNIFDRTTPLDYFSCHKMVKSRATGNLHQCPRQRHKMLEFCTQHAQQAGLIMTRHAPPKRRKETKEQP